jgi:hypothetical protein
MPTQTACTMVSCEFHEIHEPQTMNHFIPTELATWMARLALLFSFCAGLATAQTNSGRYTFVLGSGFLCDGNDASACPVTAKAARGDSYEVSGAGTFDAQIKSVTAAGIFARKSPDGTVLETGVWIANQLISFDSYGIVPGPLPHQGSVFGPAPFGPKRLPMFYGAMPTGGLAVFRIRLLSMSEPSKTAVLQANCALGKVPTERQIEGIRLSLEENGTEFSEDESGRVLFLMMRPEVSTPVKTPQQQEPATNSAEPPSS